jgi:carbon monoxide dehydrogenase subunit G
MSPVAGSVEISRPPAAVFAYVADVRRRGEWQAAVQDIQVQTPDLTGAGMQVLEKRRVPGGARTFRWQVTDYQPPASWGFRGTGNPVNAIAQMRFTPLAQGAATMVSFEMDFEARGLAKLIAPLARRGARNEIPRDLKQLKAQLESR